MYQHQSLGEALKRARKHQHKTQAQVAEALSVSIPTIRALEQGRGLVSTYQRALQAIGLSLLGWWHPAEHPHIGQTVSVLRAQRGLSQRALARATAVSHSTLHNFEKTGDCRLDILQRIFRQLNYTLWIDSPRQPVAQVPSADPITTSYFSMFSGIGGFDLGIERAKKKTSIPIVLALRKQIPSPSKSTTATSRTRTLAMRQRYNQKQFRTLTSWSRAFLVSRFQSLENGTASTTREVRSFLRLRGLLAPNSHAFFCLRTSQGFSLTTTTTPSRSSSPRWMNLGMTRNGKC